MPNGVHSILRPSLRCRLERRASRHLTPHECIWNGDTPNDGHSLLYDDKTEPRKKWLGSATNLGRKDVDALIASGSLNVIHEHGADAGARDRARDKEVINVAVGLDVSIGNNLVLKLSYEWVNASYPFGPDFMIKRRRCPRLDLLRCVVFTRNVVNG